MLSKADKIKSALAKQFSKGIALPQARRNVEKQLGLNANEAISYDNVYFVAIGLDNPIAFPKNATKAQIAKAIRDRRSGKDGVTIPNEGNTKGMSLVRWEAVAASASAGLGRKVSVAEARKLHGPKPTYAGRGTKKALVAS